MNVANLKVVLVAHEPVHLPRYKGAVFRGGFGLAFRRVACPFPKQECAACLLREKCVWSYIFATPRPKDATVMRKYETVPHPFIIEPPADDATQFPAGAELTFNLILIGRALDYVPYFILAFEQMAEQGLGPGRARFRLTAVRQDNTTLYDGRTKTITAPLKTTTLRLTAGPARITSATIRLLTPTCIIYQGKMSRRPQFHVLIRSLLRRIGLLAYFHDQPVTLDYQSLIGQAQEVKTAVMHLAGYEWRRYSSRQERPIEMQGMTGTVTYEGELGPFLPYLKAGEILHVGKGTTFGMGKYEMEVK